MLYNLSRSFGYNMLDSSISLLTRAEQMAERYNHYMLMGYCRMRRGVCLHVKHEPHLAIQDFYKAAEYYKKAKRPDMLIDVYRSISNTHMLIDENDKAIATAQYIIDAAYQIKDTIQVALVYDFKASLYTSINQYAEAIREEQKALNISKQINRKKLTAKILYNFGRIYADLAQKQKAQQYLTEALALSKETNYNENTGSCYLTMAHLSSLDNDTAQQITYTEKALEYVAKTRSEISQSACLRVLSGIYYDKKDYVRSFNYNQKAAAFSKDAIDSVSYLYDKNITGKLLVQLPDSFLQRHGYNPAEKFTKALQLHHILLDFGNRKNILKAKHDALEALSITYETMHDYAHALEAYQQLMLVKDSVLNEDKKAKAVKQELLYQFRIKEDSLRYEHQLISQQLATEQLLASQRQQQLLLLNKQKDFEKLQFLQQQTLLQQENERELAAANRLKMSSVYEAALKDKTIAAQESDLQYNRKITWYAVLAAALFCMALVLLVINLRKRARYNKVITRQNQELEQLHKVKNKLFSVVSHDMRGPIGTLISFMDLVGNQQLTPEELAGYAPMLKENLSHTSVMMDNLLKWASSQMEGFKPELGNFNLRTVTTETLQSIAYPATLKHIYLANNVPTDIEVYADVHMTQLIIRNLVSNAIKFSREDSQVVVTASATQTYMQLEIQDKGIGMLPKMVASFNSNTSPDMFKTTAGTHNEKGTGLGLLLCKTFAAMMHGSITVQSHPQTGTTFIVKLPAKA